MGNGRGRKERDERGRRRIELGDGRASEKIWRMEAMNQRGRKKRVRKWEWGETGGEKGIGKRGRKEKGGNGKQRARWRRTDREARGGGRDGRGAEKNKIYEYEIK